MGDRSNVFIQEGKNDAGTFGIGIYAHWAGEQLHEEALEALMSPEAQGRVGDPSYLARIIVHKVLESLADSNTPTGFGLWVDHPCDNDGYPILVIDARTGSAWFADESKFRLPQIANRLIDLSTV